MEPRPVLCNRWPPTPAPDPSLPNVGSRRPGVSTPKCGTISIVSRGCCSCKLRTECSECDTHTRSCRGGCSKVGTSTWVFVVCLPGNLDPDQRAMVVFSSDMGKTDCLLPCSVRVNYRNICTRTTCRTIKMSHFKSHFFFCEFNLIQIKVNT